MGKDAELVTPSGASVPGRRGGISPLELRQRLLLEEKAAADRLMESERLTSQERAALGGFLYRTEKKLEGLDRRNAVDAIV